MPLITKNILEREEIVGIEMTPSKVDEVLSNTPALLKYLHNAKSLLDDKPAFLLAYIVAVTKKAFELSGRDLNEISADMLDKFQGKMTNSKGELKAPDFFEHLEPNMWETFCGFAREAMDDGVWTDDDLIFCGAIYGVILASLIDATYNKKEYQDFMSLFTH